MGDIGLITKDDSCLLPDYLILDKYLLNTYLLNPIAGKDGYVWNLLNQKPDTFGDVCDTPLP